ncbi:MAG: hypothetical protein JJU32_14325 [Phormidium sp. BM_Day4_Bin.17]|nr:hypothetical protein [Phormidium sp. BM_Day4_Bin.17]UCJ13289.1 MAG: hypothetical protein JWS08_05815 [Phormidium sp. PBR-2020]
MKLSLPLVLFTLLSASLVTQSPAQAQDRFTERNARLEQFSLSPFDVQRAKNQARQLAERLNGGLERYRAEASMHGPSADAPYRLTETGNIEFRFLGRAPGDSQYSLETVVIVNPNTWELEATYNGRIRPEATTGS